MAGRTSLERETRAQVQRLDQPPPSAIAFGDTVVGLGTVPPLCLVLPGGLDWRRADATDSARSDASPPPAITLRYVATLTLTPSDVASLPKVLRAATLVTIHGVALGDRRLGDLVAADRPDVASLVQLYRAAPRAHPPVAKQSTPNHPVAPVLRKATGAAAVVPIDAIAHLPPSASTSDVVDAVATAVYRVVTAAFAVSASSEVDIAHFRVLGGRLAVTIVARAAEDEAATDAVTRRKAIHDSLCLPHHRPLFRRATAAYTRDGTVLGDGGWTGRLADVHVGIKGHGLGDGVVTTHLTDGSYLYCHYMQDRFNDSGWGCAYRSLQTVFSWFALQNYASFPDGILPTHQQIQKALVEVGDKPPKFVGSKEWIGANEVCYALQKLTGIESKILHVSRGSEMESKGRELAKHFDDQGTPIMVGGGVLAWTILGVARNTRTGKTKFLILDPHYEGKDDLKTIQKKGWIAWKSADVFQPNAFYNLCMPLRPSGV